LKEWLSQPSSLDGIPSSKFGSDQQPWWPGNNFTSMAITAWQAWARISNEKLHWLLKLLQTGKHKGGNHIDPECIFRSEDVPELLEIQEILKLLPRTKSSSLKVKRRIESSDASSKNKVVSECDVEVSNHVCSYAIGRQLIDARYK
jgi:hypothetical protein